MGALTQRLIDPLATVVQTAYRYPEDQAYRHVEISSMNGIIDSREKVTEGDFLAMIDYARRHHLARFTLWSASRDTGRVTPVRPRATRAAESPGHVGLHPDRGPV